MNDTELIIKLNLKRLKADLWAKPRDVREIRNGTNQKLRRKKRKSSEIKNYLDKIKDINFEEPDNPAQRLHDDASDRCYGKLHGIMQNSILG